MLHLFVIYTAQIHFSLTAESLALYHQFFKKFAFRLLVKGKKTSLVQTAATSLILFQGSEQAPMQKVIFDQYHRRSSLPLTATNFHTISAQLELLTAMNIGWANATDLDIYIRGSSKRESQIAASGTNPGTGRATQILREQRHSKLVPAQTRKSNPKPKKSRKIN